MPHSQLVLGGSSGKKEIWGSFSLHTSEAFRPMWQCKNQTGEGTYRRQALLGDTPMHQRDDLKRYPIIPVGDVSEDFASPQLGCSAPVNNAPSSSVSACASLISRSAIGVLTNRFEFADEVIDVYRPISEPPFHQMGRIGREG